MHLINPKITSYLIEVIIKLYIMQHYVTINIEEYLSANVYTNVDI